MNARRNYVLAVIGMTAVFTGSVGAGDENCPPGSSPTGGPTCGTAVPIYDGEMPFSTCGATTDGPPDPLCLHATENQINSDIWYNYTATCSGHLLLTLCDSGFDTRMAVYEGHDCLGNILACNDDFCGLQSQISAVPVTLDQLLKIRIGGFQDSEGFGTITIRCTDPNQEGPEGGSPVPPPMADDRTFVVSEPGSSSDPAYSPGLDTDCSFSDDGPLIIRIPVTRYVGPVDGNGHLMNASQLVTDGFLSKYATLTIPAFDVDSGFNSGPHMREADYVYFNDEFVGPMAEGNSLILEGEEEHPDRTFDEWTTNTFRIPIEKVKFPSARGTNGNAPTSAINIIRIEVDAENDDPYWCTALDWASLEIKCMSPIVLVHGNGSDGEFFDRQGFTAHLFNKGLVYDNSINLATNLTPPGRAPIKDNSSLLSG